MSIAEKLLQAKEDLDMVYEKGNEAGQQAEYDRFWDAYQASGIRTNYNSLFAYAGWDDNCFNPKYDITCVGESNYGQNVFYNSTRITRIPVDIIATNTSIRQMFYGALALVTIKKLVLNGVTDCSNTFVRCSKLKNITIEGSIDVNFNISATAVLSEASVQSIITTLADLTGQTTQTLTLHATVGANLTEAQKATIKAKNWTLAY